MIFDFSFVLAALVLLTGVIWAVDAWLLKPKRLAAGSAAAAPAAEITPVREPVVVEYARSFFPVLLIVLVVRSFLFEPFRIPSDSMMPTLLAGDFIFVGKYSYGLRLPVVNSKVVSLGQPKRGDVVVFRLPSDPSVNYIKRLVGLPGDHVVVRNEQVYINGEPMAVELKGQYNEHGYSGAQLGIENLAGAKHQVMYLPGGFARDFDAVVPAGHYFFMGDNRDNSRDSRFYEVGFVPEENLVGRATIIWLNWKISDMPIWSRIGTRIH